MLRKRWTVTFEAICGPGQLEPRGSEWQKSGAPLPEAQPTPLGEFTVNSSFNGTPLKALCWEIEVVLLKVVLYNTVLSKCLSQNMIPWALNQDPNKEQK